MTKAAFDDADIAAMADAIEPVYHHPGWPASIPTVEELKGTIAYLLESAAKWGDVSTRGLRVIKTPAELNDGSDAIYQPYHVYFDVSTFAADDDYGDGDDDDK